MSFGAFMDDLLARAGAVDLHEVAHQPDFRHVEVFEQRRIADHAMHLHRELGRIAEVFQVSQGIVSADFSHSHKVPVRYRRIGRGRAWPACERGVHRLCRNRELSSNKVSACRISHKLAQIPAAPSPACALDRPNAAKR
jgi:hypothetical protein